MKQDLWLWHEELKELASDEQRLWYSVLVQAIIDISNEVVDARVWMRSVSCEVCSYEWVCEVLNIESTGLRDRVLGGDFGRIKIDSLSKVWAPFSCKTYK